MRFDPSSFFVFLAVLLVEIVIGTFFHDAFVRYFLGDVLIVVLICFLVRSAFAIPLRTVVISTLIFAFCTELAQAFDLIGRLGWRDSQLAHLTIGSTFDWADLLAYTLGSGLNLWIGRYLGTLAR
jgi:ABC-type enterochelin transport system permease subunit